MRQPGLRLITPRNPTSDRPRLRIVPAVISMLVLCTGTLPVFAQLEMTPFRVVDINPGAPAKVVLSNGTTARVELLERSETADTVRGAVRVARVRAPVGARRQVTRSAGPSPARVGGRFSGHGLSLCAARPDVRPTGFW